MRPNRIIPFLITIFFFVFSRITAQCLPIDGNIPIYDLDTFPGSVYTVSGSTAGAVSTFGISDAPDTVQKMLRACDYHRAISDHGAKYAFCKGMARGIFRVMYLIMSDPLRLCDAKDLTGRQIVQIFTNWAKTNPEYWHVVPEEGFILALREAYPCK